MFGRGGIVFNVPTVDFDLSTVHTQLFHRQPGFLNHLQSDAQCALTGADALGWLQGCGHRHHKSSEYSCGPLVSLMICPALWAM